MYAISSPTTRVFAVAWLWRKKNICNLELKIKKIYQISIPVHGKRTTSPVDNDDVIIPMGQQIFGEPLLEF
jgi:hypothetical protein